MNLKDVIEFVRNLIEQHRVEIGERPCITPVTWKGIDMTIEEAKLAIRVLEAAKLKHQKYMNDSQTGGEITKLASGGAGLAAMVAGAAMLLFPPTALAGAITLVSGVGAAGVGQVVGDGVKDIGTNTNVQEIQQIDAYISNSKFKN